MKKSLIIMLIVAISFTAFAIPIQKPVEANGFVRIVAGSTASKMVKAIGEKAGLKFANRHQEDTMVSYINKKAETDPVYTKFVDDLNTAASQTKETDRPGWKKYLLDPAMWISGADILLDGYNAFMFAYENGQTVDLVTTATGVHTSNVLGCGVRAGALRVYYKPNTQYNYSVYNNPSDLSCTITYVDDLHPADSSGYVGYKYKIRHPDGRESGNYKSSNPDHLYVVRPFKWDGGSGFDIPDQIVPSMYDIPEQYEVIDISEFDHNNMEPIVVYVPEPDPQKTQDPLDPYPDEPWNDVQEPPPPKEDPTDPPAEEPPDEEKPSGWKWWDWLLKPLVKLIEGIVSALKEVTDFILGLVEWLIGLIVPSSDYLKDFFNHFKGLFDAKIPIIPQLQEFFQSIEGASVNGEVPEFTVDIPDKWGGGTFPVIDFSYFDQYREWILNFIRFTAWFVFLRRLYNRIPRMIL